MEAEELIKQAEASQERKDELFSFFYPDVFYSQLAELNLSQVARRQK